MNEELKLDCMGDYWGTYEGRLQILYLRHKLKLSLEEISHITSYAVKTVRDYLRKYAHLIDDALRLFYFKTFKKEYLDMPNLVDYECDMPIDGKYYAYVCEVYDNNLRKFLKIGYSKDVEVRMIDHATNEKYGGNKVKVLALYDFNNPNDALDMENSLRKYYQHKNNGADYVEKDRFTEQIPCAEDFLKFEKRAESLRNNDWLA